LNQSFGQWLVTDRHRSPISHGANVGNGRSAEFQIYAVSDSSKSVS
jgi:hypothetical protein